MMWHPAFALLLLSVLVAVMSAIVSTRLGDEPAGVVFRLVMVGFVLVALFADEEGV